jgi:hypothetical protein
MGDPDPVASVKAVVDEVHLPAVLGGIVTKILCLNPACSCSA